MSLVETSPYEREPGELPGGYLGALHDSLQLLPRSYQVMCICSVLCLFWLDTPIVVALLNNFHINFGAKFVWAEAYTDLLDALQLYERVALAVYAIGLAGVIAAFLTVRGMVARSSLSPLQHTLFPGREQLGIFTWIIFSASAGVAVLLNTIPSCSVVETPAVPSAANTTTAAGSEVTSSTAIHAGIQLKILVQVGVWWLQRTLLPCAVGAAYRFLRDSWRRQQGQCPRPLRQYVASIAWTRVLLRVFEFATSLSLLGSAAIPSAELLEVAVEVLSAITIALLLNHEYGPADPDGDIRGLLWGKQLLHGMACVTFCASVPAVVALLLVAVLVGVHVVELIAVWFLFTVVSLWVPAAFDACALDYLASMLAAVCGVIWSFELAPLDTVVRMWLAWFAAATALATFINFSSNVFRSRRLSVGITLLATAIVFYRQEQKLQFTSNIASAIVAMDSRAIGGFELHSLLADSGTRANLSLVSNLLMAGAVAALFAGCNEVLAWKRSSKSRASIAARRRRKLPLVTFEVLVIKLCQVLVFFAFVSVSVAVTVLLQDTLLPAFLSILPRQTDRLIAPVLGCLVFGAMMDSREDFLLHVLRALGLVDSAALVVAEGDVEQHANAKS